jgi:hypothetical protein
LPTSSCRSHSREAAISSPGPRDPENATPAPPLRFARIRGERQGRPADAARALADVLARDAPVRAGKRFAALCTTQGPSDCRGVGEAGADLGPDDQETVAILQRASERRERKRTQLPVRRRLPGAEARYEDLIQFSPPPRSRRGRHPRGRAARRRRPSLRLGGAAAWILGVLTGPRAIPIDPPAPRQPEQVYLVPPTSSGRPHEHTVHAGDGRERRCPVRDRELHVTGPVDQRFDHRVGPALQTTFRGRAPSVKRHWSAVGPSR